MSEEERIKTIVNEVLAAREEITLKRQKFVVGLSVTVALSMLSMGALGTVRIIQNDTRLSTHMEDGHPSTVRDIVSEVKSSLIRIEVRQENLLEDMATVKKKLSDG